MKTLKILELLSKTEINHIAMKYIINKYILSLVLFGAALSLSASNRATVKYTDAVDKSWIVANDVMSFEIEHTSAGIINPKSFYNIEAGVNYLGASSQLFSYIGQYIPVDGSKELSPELFTFESSNSGWEYKGHLVEDIVMSKALNSNLLGKKLSITFAKSTIELKLVFEIFDGRSGLRYQTFIKNTHPESKMIIEKSDVLKLALPKRAHNLHYVTNSKWYSTVSNLDESVMYNKGKNVTKCLINLYTSGDGWYIAPEVNWKTQYGPEKARNVDDPDYEYMLRSFAEVSAWSKNTDFVKVSTCPESLQLVLLPNEEFEYISVNLTAFKGDIVDGKMAVEEHLRKRFRFNNTTTSFVVNDWDWFTRGNRTEQFYKDSVIPQAKKAGFEMLMFDDGWNNYTSDNKWINNVGLSRDPVEAGPKVTPDMLAFTEYVKNQGLEFGLWYSMTGGYHNAGNDLADRNVLSAKKEKIQYMIDNYNMSHQAVDLTQYWQNLDESSESHPSDNVYRKAVLTRNLMNEIVDDNPKYVVKVTSELDIFPTQLYDRMTELLHLPNNGWMTITGFDNNIDVPGLFFGHYPLNALYISGNPTGSMDAYYTYMLARNVKVYKQPNEWDEDGVVLMSKFNKWRKSDRIKSLTENVTRPVFLGENWNNKEAAQWNPKVGPYLWTYVNDDKSQALLLGVTNGRSTVSIDKIPLRWLDDNKTYLVEDISMNDGGEVLYRFVGKYTGSDLNAGIETSSLFNNSEAKAFWITESSDKEKQVVYADESITSYTENLTGNTLTINAKGIANTSGKMIVYGKTENLAMTVNLSFDNTGNASANVTAIVKSKVIEARRISQEKSLDREAIMREDAIHSQR